MIVTIHQPEHMPWCGFLHKASQADVFVLLDNVQYRKNYFQNRNQILGPNGPQWLTVPVALKGHTEGTIREMEISPGANWADKWWKSIYFSYLKTPYFSAHGPFFKELSQRPWKHIAQLNEEIIRYFFREFDIQCRVVKASELGIDGVRSQLLRDICVRLGAEAYLAGRHGKDYLDETLFRDANINVRYHEFVHPVYPQRPGAEFVPNMSAVDLLFRAGPKSAEVLRSTEPSRA